MSTPEQTAADPITTTAMPSGATDKIGTSDRQGKHWIDDWRPEDPVF